MAQVTTRHFPDRDRLSVVTAVIVLAYALARIVELPSRLLSATLFGSSIGFELNGQVIILLMVAALISTGSDTLIRSHPRFARESMRTFAHWILPGGTALALGLLLNLAPSGRCGGWGWVSAPCCWSRCWSPNTPSSIKTIRLFKQPHSA